MFPGSRKVLAFLDLGFSVVWVLTAWIGRRGDLDGVWDGGTTLFAGGVS